MQPSWPYQCGMEARRADDAKLAEWLERTADKLASNETAPTRKANPLCGRSGIEWQMGYDLVPWISGEKNVRCDHAGDDASNTSLDRSAVCSRAAPLVGSKTAGVDNPGTVRLSGSIDRDCRGPELDVVFGITLIVDYCSLLHRAFHAAPPSPVHAVRSMFETLANCIARLSPEFVIFAMDGGYVERSALHPDYKAHRDAAPDELRNQLILGHRAVQAIGWPSIRVVGWEADDVAASLAALILPNSISGEVLILTSDKDALQTIPLGATVYHPWDGGKVVNAKAVNEKYGVEPSQMGDYLALVGDTSDNVPGVEGIGAKTAATLLKEHGDLESILEAAASGLVKGKLGERLASDAGRNAARLGRQLVQLCTELPVGVHWTDWPVSKPRAGWKQRLTDMKLHVAAQRLSEVLPAGVEHKGSSHFEIEFTRPVPAIELTGATLDSAMSAVIAESSEGDVEEWRRWPSCLEELPMPASVLDFARFQYRVGREHSIGFKLVENGWRPESAYFDAYFQGKENLPLQLDPVKLAAHEERELKSLGIAPIELPAAVEPLPGQMSLNLAASSEPTIPGPADSPEPTCADEETPESTASFSGMSFADDATIAPRISSLFELEGLCGDGREDRDFWRCLAIAAAQDLRYQERLPHWREAIDNLLQHRRDVQAQFSADAPALTPEESIRVTRLADASVCEEANLLFQRLFEGGDMAAAATRSRTKKPPTDNGELNQETALRHLLCPSGTDAVDWKKFAKEPRTDSEIRHRLQALWSTPRKSADPPAFASAHMGPMVWLGQTDSKSTPSLSGDELLDSVRAIMQIERAEEPDEPKPKPKTKTELFLKIETKVEVRPVVWFHKSPFDKRGEPTQAELRELGQSLKDDGQWNCCLARPDGQHIAGWRRVLAARLMKIDSLQVRIVHCDDLTARRLVLEENAKRKDLTEREQCEAYNELLAEYEALGRTQAQLAKAIKIDESTLSNKLRLKSLTPAVWSLYESGVLNIDQIRQVATHATQPGFIDGFIGRCPNNLGKLGGPGFTYALEGAIGIAYRPMTKDERGNGCQFKAKPAQKEELGIVEIEHPSLGKIPVATNIEKWNELNDAAKGKAQAKEESNAQQPVPTKAPAIAQRKIRAVARQQCVERAWAAAYATAIRSQFEKVRAKDIPALMRLILLVEQCTSPRLRMVTGELFSEEADFIECCRRRVHGMFGEKTTSPFAPHYSELGIGDLRAVAKFLRVDPSPHWRVTLELLATCTDKELAELRDELELEKAIEDKNRVDFELRLMNEWHKGDWSSWCPDMFTLKEQV